MLIFLPPANTPTLLHYSPSPGMKKSLIFTFYFLLLKTAMVTDNNNMVTDHYKRIFCRPISSNQPGLVLNQILHRNEEWFFFSHTVQYSQL